MTAVAAGCGDTQAVDLAQKDPDGDTGSDGDTDVDTDTDTDTDTDADSDTYADGPCPDVPTESCGYDEFVPILESGETPYSGQVKFVDIDTRTSQSIIGVLADVEVGDDLWAPVVFAFDVNSAALSGDPEVIVASGEELFSGLAPLGVTGYVNTTIPDTLFAVLLMADDEDRYVIAAVPDLTEEPFDLSLVVDDPFPNDAEVNVLDSLFLYWGKMFAFGDRIWSAPESMEWSEFASVEAGPPLNAVRSTCESYIGVVGDSGRVVTYEDGVWQEREPATEEDLLAFDLAFVPDLGEDFLGGYVIAAGGEGGTLLHTLDNFEEGEWARVCQLGDDAITALDWNSGWEMRPLLVGTDQGDLFQLKLRAPVSSCIAADFPDAVLEVAMVGLDDVGSYVLVLTENTLYALPAPS